MCPLSTSRPCRSCGRPGLSSSMREACASGGSDFCPGQCESFGPTRVRGDSGADCLRNHQSLRSGSRASACAGPDLSWWWALARAGGERAREWRGASHGSTIRPCIGCLCLAHPPRGAPGRASSPVLDGMERCETSSGRRTAQTSLMVPLWSTSGVRQSKLAHVGMERLGEGTSQAHAS